MATVTFPFIKKQISIGTVILLCLTAIGVFAAHFRWVDGFSRISSLSDSRPWVFGSVLISL